jgi:Protein of unknown function (DUF982)
MRPVDPCLFDKLVFIEHRRAGTTTRIGSVREAADCLIGGGWPYPRGPKYLVALRACDDALDGSGTPEVARQAFLDAAREAGILIHEAP